jgi:hypothetical protein
MFKKRLPAMDTLRLQKTKSRVEAVQTLTAQIIVVEDQMKIL